MNKTLFLILIVSLLLSGNFCKAAEILKIGAKVKAGYSTEKMDCEVLSFYGNIVTLKSTESGKQKVFHIFSDKIGDGIFTPDSKIPKEDEVDNDDLFIDMFVEACHPNGEWYVGKVLDKYGKFVKVQMGPKGWSPIWVNKNQYFKYLKVEKEVKFMDFRHRQVGILTKEGILKNQKDVIIGRVYSNGKVYDGKGEIIGAINQDGSIEKNNTVIYKANIQFNNGLEYLDKENKPICVIRIKSNSLYQPNRPDIVNLFFEAEQLKGNMRVCGALFLLLKDKF